MRVAVESSADEVSVHLRGIIEDLGAYTERFVAKALLLIEAKIKDAVLAWTSGTDTRKSGALLQSWAPVFLRRAAGEVAAGVFSSSPYARIHWQGGVIHPTVAKFLTVPLVELPIGTRARDLADLVMIRSRRGNLILAKIEKAVRGRKARITPIFALKESVEIRAGKYDLARVADEAAPELATLAHVMAAELLRGAA